MSPALFKVLVVMAPTCILFFSSAIIFVRQKRLGALLQLLGTTGALVVVFTHLCEALQLFPWMHWGQERSAGHYLDLSGAMAGIIFFPAGYLLHALGMRPPSGEAPSATSDDSNG